MNKEITPVGIADNLDFNMFKAKLYGGTIYMALGSYTESELVAVTCSENDLAAELAANYNNWGELADGDDAISFGSIDSKMKTSHRFISGKRTTILTLKIVGFDNAVKSYVESTLFNPTIRTFIIKANGDSTGFAVLNGLNWIADWETNNNGLKILTLTAELGGPTENHVTIHESADSEYTVAVYDFTEAATIFDQDGNLCDIGTEGSELIDEAFDNPSAGATYSDEGSGVHRITDDVGTTSWTTKFMRTPIDNYVEGARYRLTLSLRASVNRSAVYLRQKYSTSAAIIKANFSITTDWVEYDIIFTALSYGVDFSVGCSAWSGTQSNQWIEAKNISIKQLGDTIGSVLDIGSNKMYHLAETDETLQPIRITGGIDFRAALRQLEIDSSVLTGSTGIVTGMDDAVGVFLIEDDKITGENIYDALGSYQCKLIEIKDVSDKILVKKTGTDIRIISLFDSARDILIDFADTPYNGLKSFRYVYLRDKQAASPAIYEGSVLSFTELNSAGSDNIGPFNSKANGSAFNDWVGGAHLSTDEEPENTTWVEITASNWSAGTLTLSDATDFPVPNGGEVHVFMAKEWNGSSYGTYGRYSYTGKTGNQLTGVIAYYSGSDLDNIDNIGGANPPQAVFVMTTAETNSISYELDGVEVSDESWHLGDELEVTILNYLYDPHTKRSNPNTPANWDVMLEETVVYKLRAGGCIDINYNSVVKKLIDIAMYYGLQAVANNEWAEYLYFIEASNDAKQAYGTGKTSGAISSYLNCNKLISVNETDNMIQDFMLDLSYGLPLAYLTYINTPSSTSRVANPSKHYFYQITAQTAIAVDTELNWRGTHNYTVDLSTTSDIFVYRRRFNGEDYIIIDFTDSLSFPQTYECILADVMNKVCTIEYKTSGITVANEISGTVSTIGCGLNITAANSGQVVVKL